jgi:valyl-tRNA synthetase
MELDEFITIATTRPETMLGDTAIAVNPKDERFKSLLVKQLQYQLLEERLRL